MTEENHTKLAVLFLQVNTLEYGHWDRKFDLIFAFLVFFLYMADNLVKTSDPACAKQLCRMCCKMFHGHPVRLRSESCQDFCINQQQKWKIHTLKHVNSNSVALFKPSFLLIFQKLLQIRVHPVLQILFIRFIILHFFCNLLIYYKWNSFHTTSTTLRVNIVTFKKEKHTKTK